MIVDPRLYDSIRRLEATLDSSLELQEIMTAEGVPKSEKSQSGLTIFVPNWNHAMFLPRALKSAFEAVSILEAAGIEAEVLVVDDASRDGSLKLLRTIQALYVPKMRVIRLYKNYGQARLTNLALAVSRFRYLLRLDADNELVPENILSFFESILQTKATLLYGNLIRLKGGRVEERTPLVSNMAASSRLLRQNYIDALSVMDVCDILELGGFSRVNLYSPEDWEMNLHLMAEEKLIVFVPLVMGYYHIISQAASSELGRTDAGLKVLKRIYFQTGLRDWDRGQVGRVYHPEVGFIDEWGY